jgi:hypothetical protein
MNIMFIILIALAIVGLFLHNAFLKLLRKLFPMVWEDLGSPTPFMNNSIANSMLVVQYLLKRKYKVLGNANLTRLGDFVLIFSIAYLIFFVVVIIVSAK